MDTEGTTFTTEDLLNETFAILDNNNDVLNKVEQPHWPQANEIDQKVALKFHEHLINNNDYNIDNNNNNNNDNNENNNTCEITVRPDGVYAFKFLKMTTNGNWLTVLNPQGTDSPRSWKILTEKKEKVNTSLEQDFYWLVSLRSEPFYPNAVVEVYNYCSRLNCPEIRQLNGDNTDPNNTDSAHLSFSLENEIYSRIIAQREEDILEIDFIKR